MRQNYHSPIFYITLTYITRCFIAQTYATRSLGDGDFYSEGNNIHIS